MVSVTRTGLSVANQPIYLRSGEIVYFRLPPETWRDRLTKLKDCGGNAVSFYIPWNWHEPEAGAFDLRGETHPSRNLAGFLELACELGLYLIVKPGPFICNEWQNGAIPQWLLDAHPEIRSLDARGEFHRGGYQGYPPVSYLHPAYLGAIGRWYDQVCAVVSSFAGRIVLIQPDNEVRLSYTLHDPFLSDYSEFVAGKRGEVEGLYHHWLRRKYDDSIDDLNRSHGSVNERFVDVYPPTVQPGRPKDLVSFLDWRHFKEWMVLEFVDTLCIMMASRGLNDIPVSLNAILDPPSLPSFYPRFLERGWQAITGPSLYGPRLAPSDLSYMINAMEFVRACGSPAICPETGVGYWEDTSQVAPGDVDLTFKALIGHGLNGLNFLEFAGGENPPGYGCQYYEWQAPVASDGSLRESYPVVREIGRFTQAHADLLLPAEKLFDVAIGSYAPYQALCGVATQPAGLHHGIGKWADYTWELGTLFLLGNINYGIADLETSTVEDLLRWKQLWIISYDFMGSAVQSKLVQYVRCGGHLVLLPEVPYLDENMQACTILCLELFPGQAESRQLRECSVLNMLFGRPRISTYGCLNTYELQAQALPVALDDKDAVVGYTRMVGSGKATILGTHLKYVYRVHPTILPGFLAANGIERRCWAEDSRILVVQRSTEDYSYVSALNLHETGISTRLIVTDPVTRAHTTIPEGAPVTVPARSGLILGLRLPLPGCRAGGPPDVVIVRGDRVTAC